MNVDVLAIGAHPDDIELACGGTIAKLVRQGKKVALCDLTQGELGTRGTKKIRLREAQLAADILGVVARRNLLIPDGSIEVNKKNILKIITLIRELRPSLLIVPYSIERHPDHVHASEICREAWYYSGLEKIKTRHNGKSQERHRPHHYFEFIQWMEFEPSFIIDISDTFGLKMKSVRAHASQFYNPESKESETKLSGPDFLEVIETRCRYFGSKIGVKYGEPFISRWSLGIDDPFRFIVNRG
ncbi:MAG: bacillithiol biosynthesis deacetylase BshB1 [Bacteroidetes bacterium]|nr:bacillithiol biosynthesis deacetylase BshB1 [Bacteroidota bacterium]